MALNIMNSSGGTQTLSGNGAVQPLLQLHREWASRRTLSHLSLVVDALPGQRDQTSSVYQNVSPRNQQIQWESGDQWRITKQELPA